MSIYCTYSTIYTGDKMPPFYIGYSLVAKVKNGYRGTVCSRKYKKIWQEELANNPHLFETTIIDVYDTQEEAVAAERVLLESVQAHKNPLYINMAIGRDKFYIPRKYLNRKEYYYNNKEALNEKARRDYEKHKDKRLETAAIRRKVNNEKYSEWHKQHYALNKNRIREQQRQYQKEYLKRPEVIARNKELHRIRRVKRGVPPS